MLSLFVKCEKYISDKERRPVNSLGTAWICPTNFCIEYKPITYTISYIHMMIASKSITRQELLDYQVEPYPIYDGTSPKVVETSQCPNVSTTPLRQWGFWQCLPFSCSTLRGKHCRHPIAVMGVVDKLGFLSSFSHGRINWIISNIHL